MSDSFRVLVTDKIAVPGLSALTGDPRFRIVEAHDSSAGDFEAGLRTADALLVRSATKVTPELLDGAPELKVVGRAGVGVDNIDIPACTARGIAVLNAPAGNTVSAAELTMALLLAVVRRVAAADASTRGGAWERGKFNGTELRGRTLGLVGGGRIGSEVAKRARAFGMRILLHDPYLPDDHVREMGAEPISLDDLTARADVISLHIPLSEATHGLFGVERIARMKKGAVLVNASRGGVVDEAALAAALEAGHLFGAALDVYENEPLEADSPLRSAPNLVLTPHLGASTGEAQERVAEEIAVSVRAALAEDDLSTALNAPGVGGDARRRIAPLLELGEKLGRLAADLAPGPVRAISIRYAGSTEDGLQLLPRQVLVGLLEPVLGRGAVNVVNASLVAEARGVEATLTSQPPRSDYSEQISVELETGAGPLRVRGAILGPGHARLVGIDDYQTSVEPQGSLLILRNRDVPGVIGRVGSLLGERRLNIAGYHQSRAEAGGPALAAVRVDEDVSPAVLEALRSLPEIESAHWVHLG